MTRQALRHVARSSLLFLGILTVTSDAGAQTLTAPRADRPYRGLFGSGVDDPSQLLTATAMIGGGADDDVLAGSGDRSSAPETSRLRGGRYGFGAAGISYIAQGTRASFSANGNVASRYYPRADNEYVVSRSAGTRVDLQPFAATRLFAGASIGYQPYNLIDLFPAFYEASGGRLSTLEQDYAITGEYYTRTTLQGGAAQAMALGRRTGLEFDYSYSRTEHTELDRQYESHRAGGLIRHNVTRSVSVRAGYHYRTFHYPGAARDSRLEVHDIDAGVDANKALSLTRRTTLSFSSGSSAFVRDDETFFRVNGDALLSHEMGRTWNTSLAYSRNLRFLDTFDEPVSYDALTASLSGLLSRRLQFALIARAAGGRVGTSNAGREYRTYAGSATLTQGLTRHIALSGSYFYNQHEFEEGALLPAGVPSSMKRHGVRATVTVWAPLFYRGRRP